MDDPSEPQFLHVHTAAPPLPMSDHLRHSTAGSRCLLQPMATEAIDEDEVPQNRVGANDAVLVKRIVVVVTHPRTP